MYETLIEKLSCNSVASVFGTNTINLGAGLRTAKARFLVEEA